MGKCGRTLSESVQMESCFPVRLVTHAKPSSTETTNPFRYERRGPRPCPIRVGFLKEHADPGAAHFQIVSRLVRTAYSDVPETAGRDGALPASGEQHRGAPSPQNR
ncbi:hypothetical protein CEXT_280481 [Caerostris extrusa]|uniref:Uncharacterized protein n=1 Tax=Caerostris extrusa TaxID=172846 RepID=A0AAV4NTJ1_CAEEX|nr:hypothetical protein CEXT_280481 [Caerostris extrusa]